MAREPREEVICSLLQRLGAVVDTCTSQDIVDVRWSLQKLGRQLPAGLSDAFEVREQSIATALSEFVSASSLPFMPGHGVPAAACAWDVRRLAAVSVDSAKAEDAGEEWSVVVKAGRSSKVHRGGAQGGRRR